MRVIRVVYCADAAVPCARANLGVATVSPTRTFCYGSSHAGFIRTIPRNFYTRAYHCFGRFIQSNATMMMMNITNNNTGADNVVVVVQCVYALDRVQYQHWKEHSLPALARAVETFSAHVSEPRLEHTAITVVVAITGVFSPRFRFARDPARVLHKWAPRMRTPYVVLFTQNLGKAAYTHAALRAMGWQWWEGDATIRPGPEEGSYTVAISPAAMTPPPSMFISIDGDIVLKDELTLPAMYTALGATVGSADEEDDSPSSLSSSSSSSSSTPSPEPRFRISFVAASVTGDTRHMPRHLTPRVCVAGRQVTAILGYDPRDNDPATAWRGIAGGLIAFDAHTFAWLRGYGSHLASGYVPDDVDLLRRAGAQGLRGAVLTNHPAHHPTTGELVHLYRPKGPDDRELNAYLLFVHSKPNHIIAYMNGRPPCTA